MANRRKNWKNGQTDYRTELAISPSGMLDIVRIKESLDNKRLNWVFTPIFVIILAWMVYYGYRTWHDPSFIVYQSVPKGQLEVSKPDVPNSKQPAPAPSHLSK